MKRWARAKPLTPIVYFVICSNVLGGCMGSTGPLSPHPSKKGVWGGDFPVLTIGDMVRAQKLLIEHLGIEQLYSVVGGSMGGMQSLQWAVLYPDCVHSVVAIATAARHSAQNISLHEIGRQAIVGDPQWHDGFYANREQSPQHGLAVARMMAHVSYLVGIGFASQIWTQSAKQRFHQLRIRG